MATAEPALPPGWFAAPALARLIAQWRATPRPDLATPADLQAATTARCPRCGHPCAGAMVLDRGRGWPAWRVAVCKSCEVYGDLAGL